VTTPGRERRGLLDTSALIDVRADRLAAAVTDVAVSAVSIAELSFGVTATADPVVGLQRRRRLDAILDAFDVLAFDTAVAEFYGALATLVRAARRNPRPRRMDLQIAATAARHDLVLCTHNAADFAGLESAVEVVDLDA